MALVNFNFEYEYLFTNLDVHLFTCLLVGLQDELTCFQ